MKIALVGNMNNNNFSLMRYFRDLGADAYLLLWSTDRWGSQGHFTPQNDTWELSKWERFIHQTGLRNSGASLIGSLRRLQPPPSRRTIRERLAGFDAYVGSGYAGAILARIGMRLDIFYPYGTGIEGVGDRETRARLRGVSLLQKFIISRVRDRQVAAIRSAKHCLNAEMSLTRQTFSEIGKDFIPLAVPMVYNREPIPPAEKLPPPLGDLLKRLDGYDLKILSHCRQLWVPQPGFPADQWEKRSKHNDWLIRGFAEFLSHGRKERAVLLLFDYGTDVNATKALIADFGVEQDVIWLPTMSRKEILCLLSNCDVGVGEFANDKGLLWGGTGWEVLASGRPLLQTVNFTNDEFRNLFGHDLPPILDVKCPEDVTKHLNDFMDNKEKYVAIGKKSKDWFETNNGIGLAKKWLELLAT